MIDLGMPESHHAFQSMYVVLRNLHKVNHLSALKAQATVFCIKAGFLDLSDLTMV